jgi:hypothetical protein
MVDFCWKKQIILAWMHRDQLLNEVARDFAFYIGQHTKPVGIHFSSIQAQSITTFDS